MSADSHAPPSHLAHHFENLDQQFQSAKLGMWIFLATEILFFGGLFVAYSVYRANHPEIFIYAHHFLDKRMGALNTVILICSSFTIAWAVRAAQLRQTRLLALLLVLTLACAGGFLGIKYVEYSHKWHLGLLWAGSYAPTVHHDDGHGATAGEAEPIEPIAVDEPVAAAPPPARAEGVERSNIAAAAEGPQGLADTAAAASTGEVIAEPRNARTFFSIYFLMTGLHGIHVIGGMGAMVWLLALVRRGAFDDGHFTRVDMVALYWHLVDLIWIYLFLLLYLIH